MKSALDEFFGHPVLKEIQRYSPGSETVHLRTRFVFFDTDNVSAIHFYEVREGEFSTRINIDAKRVVEQGEVYWTIVTIYAEDELRELQSDYR